MKKVIVLILSVFLMTSCSDKEEKEELIGIWDDNIKLSTKNVDFSSEKDSVIITTEGDWWWIDGITFEDSIYTYYGREDINLESEVYTINEDHFVVERRDKNTLFIQLDENSTGIERIMNITLEAGDYFDYLQIKQSAH